MPAFVGTFSPLSLPRACPPIRPDECCCESVCVSWLCGLGVIELVSQSVLAHGMDVAESFVQSFRPTGMPIPRNVWDGLGEWDFYQFLGAERVLGGDLFRFAENGL